MRELTSEELKLVQGAGLNPFAIDGDDNWYNPYVRYTSGIPSSNPSRWNDFRCYFRVP